MKIKLLALGAVFASLCASVQGQAPVNKTPKLHLSFDSVSGSTVLNTGWGGSALNGTLNGGASIVSGGRFGNALQVTGVNSPDASCRIANAVVPLNVQAGNAWTVAMWIKSTTQGGTWAYQGDGGWNQGHTTFAMLVNNGTTGVNGHAAGGVRHSSGWEQGTTVVDDGVWHHIVFTFDGTTKIQYVDGVVDTWVADQWNNSVATGNQFWIGGGGTGQGDGQVCLNGLIDEAYVFDRALSQADVTQLYNSNTYPTVPLTVTVTPTSGYRGQVVDLTATATPASGTVTNAKVDLSAFGLSSSATLGQASANVFTNRFTIPNNTNAPIGVGSAIVTVISTEPLVGSGSAAFRVLARPPTNAIVVTPLTGVTAYEYTEVSFHFAATNDAPNDAPFPMAYSWYKNNVLVSTNPMGPYFTFLSTPADNGAQIYAIARVADTNFSSISVTSAVVTLTLNSGTPVYTNGLKSEFFAGGTRIGAEIGNVAPGIISYVTNADRAEGLGDNYSRRFSGYFIPPTTDDYVFFVASDDDCDVFLNTNGISPAGKQLIAQEDGWSGTRNWQTVGGNGSSLGQKRSDQWTNSVGATPYAAGIHLLAGQKYYFEAVMHQGGGGDNWGVTYQTVAELTLDPTLPANGSASRMTVESNNIAFASWPGTAIVWTTTPTNLTVFEGDTANFYSLATSDGEMAVTYQWYVNNALYSGASGRQLSLPLVTSSQNGASIKVVATMPLLGLSITSSPVTLTVNQAVFETGFAKEERWQGMTSRNPVINGTAGNPTFSIAMPGFIEGASDSGTGQGDFAMRHSGFFIPPTTGDYVFFTASDDDSVLFVSTDNTPANKRQVALEAGWSGVFNWTGIGGVHIGGGSTPSQKRSDQWSPDGGVTVPYAAGIHLIGNQRYYVEQVHHNGAPGGTHVGAYYKLISDPDPVAGTLPNLVGNRVGISAKRISYVAFTQQPANVITAPMGYATFQVAGTTDSQLPIANDAIGLESRYTNNFLAYQWYKNGTPITGANGRTLTLGPLMPGDSGATVYCAIRALGYADNALNPIWSNSTPATVTIAPQAVFEPGLLMEDWWTNTTSRQVVENGSVGNPHFSYATPIFEGPNGNGAGSGPTIDYAHRISGFFVPPTNGLYTFFTDSDDDSDFFISTDGTPANKRLVAQEAGWSGVRNWVTAGGGGSVASQKRSDSWSPNGGATIPYSSGISLNGGQAYYIEQVHHNGAAGGTHTTATFKGYSDPDPVNGEQTQFATNRIGIYVPRIQWVAFLQQPGNASVVSGGNSVTFTVAGTNDLSPVKIGDTGNPLNFINTAGGSQLQYQWYKNGVPIPGANSASYTLPYALPSDNGAQFVCGLRAIGYADNSLNRIFSNSVPAVLTVVTDTVPPTISYAATFANTNQPQFVVNITFNKRMDLTTLSNALNYSISGVTITNVTVASNGKTVSLIVNQLPTLPLNVTVNGVKDVSGNQIVLNSTAAINSEKLTFSDIGTPGTDPAYPSFASVTANGGYIITAQGSDFWNTADGGNFAWELKTNDFDAVVRVVSLGHSHASAKAALMVRETLDAFSRDWYVANDPAPDSSSTVGANNIEANMRDTLAGPTAGWRNLAGNTPPMYPNAWLRLKRTGNVLEAFASSNMVSWTALARYDTGTNVNGALPSVVYLGLATTAHGNDTLGGPPPPPFQFYNTAEYADYSSGFVPLAPAAHLTISKSGGNVTISWTPAGGHLESTSSLGGTPVWQNQGTANPATLPIGSTPQFFRVVNP